MLYTSYVFILCLQSVLFAAVINEQASWVGIILKITSATQSYACLVAASVCDIIDYRKVIKHPELFYQAYNNQTEMAKQSFSSD